MTALIDGPRIGPASGTAPRQLVVLLHGYGSNGADLIGLAPYWREALPGALFVAPNAPEPCPGAPGGFQWWGFSSPDPLARAGGVRLAAAALEAFVDAELAGAGLSEDRLALVGFSQGTMLALSVGPRRSRPIAGIVGYSGRLAEGGLAPGEIVTRPPVLLIHGDADPMIPLSAFLQTRETLTGLGFAVESHVSPGLAHSIDAAGLALGGRFLARVLG